MGLHELKSPPGSRHARRRRGLGDAAGQGSYSGRGFKGQKKRGSVAPFFEGGQLKLVKRLPYMRGFHNPFRTEYVGVNLDRLKAFGTNSEVSPESLVDRGLVKSPNALVKILGTGEAPQGVKVTAHAFSASAKAKIEAAGGTATVLSGPATKPAPSRIKGHLDQRAKLAAAKSRAEAALKRPAQPAPGAAEGQPAQKRPDEGVEGQPAAQPSKGRKAKN